MGSNRWQEENSSTKICWTFCGLGYFNYQKEPAPALAIFADEKCLLRLPENKASRAIADRLSVKAKERSVTTRDHSYANQPSVAILAPEDARLAFDKPTV